jgi:hypothetical protein
MMDLSIYQQSSFAAASSDEIIKMTRNIAMFVCMAFCLGAL